MPLYLQGKLISRGIHRKLIEALLKRLSLAFGPMDEPDFRVEIWTIQLSSQAWSAPKWTPQNCKWCTENGVLAAVMECFCVWEFSLFEHKLLAGIGGSHDLFCVGLSNPEVAVVQCSSSLLPAVPMNSRSPSCIRLCLIEGITVLFWTLGFSECSSAKSKAIQRKTESQHTRQGFSAL